MDCQFESLIFFDFETTGLFPRGYFAPHEVKTSSNGTVFANELKSLINSNYGAPKVTEFAFAAVSKDDFLNAINAMKEKFDKAGNSGSLKTDVPFDVHNRLVKPSLTDSQWIEYEGKRMRQPDIFVQSKEKLLEKNDFASEWKELKEFLESAPKPACFVAHNGVGYDYRILFEELKNVGVGFSKESQIPEKISFVDSLLAFQKIEHDHKNARENAPSPALARRSAANSCQSFPQSFSFIGGYRKRAYTSRGPSFSLPILYNDIVKGHATKFHHALGDSEALIQVSLAYGNDFLKYVNNAAAELPF